LLAQEKLITSKTKYFAIQLLAVGLLIIMCASNLAAEIAFPQNNVAPDLSKTTLTNDRSSGLRGSSFAKKMKQGHSALFSSF